MDVANEVELRGSSPRHALRTHSGLQNLARLGFPSDQRGATLDPVVNSEVETIRSAWADAGDHPKMHRGEIATVLHAAHLGGDLVILDDGDGKGLARARGVPFLGTTNLVAEMAVAGAIAEPAGRAIYLSVQRRAALTEANWQSALARYRSL